MSFKKLLEQHKQKKHLEPLSQPASAIDYPTDAFPDFYKKVIETRQRDTNQHVSHLGTSLLACASSMAGNALRVQVVPDLEPIPLIFWTVIVDTSGQGKSGALNFGFAPLERYQMEKDVQTSRREEELEQKIAQIQNDIREASDMNTKKELRTQLEETKSEEVVRDSYLVQDFTFEYLYKGLSLNQRGLVAKYPEFAVWLNSFGKYSKGGGGKDEESRWLSLYDAEPLRLNRSGTNKSLTVYNPFIAVSGAIQPGLLGEFARNQRHKTGFVFRVIFSYPNDRDIPTQDYLKERDPHIKEAYCERMAKIMDLEMVIEDGVPMPKTIPFDPHALNALEKWVNENRRIVNNLGYDQETKDDFKSIYLRLEMNMFRICGTLELLKWTVGESSLEAVTVDTVKRAIKLAEYYRKTSEKVYDQISQQRFAMGEAGRQPVNWKELFNYKREATREQLELNWSSLYDTSIRTMDNYIKKAKQVGLVEYDFKSGKYKFKGR